MLTLKNASINECPQITQIDFSSNSDLESISLAEMTNLNSAKYQKMELLSKILFFMGLCTILLNLLIPIYQYV